MHQAGQAHAECLCDLLDILIPGEPFLAGDVVGLPKCFWVSTCLGESAADITGVAAYPQRLPISMHDHWLAFTDSVQAGIPTDRVDRAATFPVGIRRADDGQRESAFLFSSSADISRGSLYYGCIHSDRHTLPARYTGSM